MVQLYSFINEINTKTTEYEKSYSNLEHIILELKNDFNYELVTLKLNEAKDSLSFKNLNGYIFYTLYSFEYSSKCISYYESKGNNLSNGMLNLMNTRINSFNSELLSILKFDNLEKHILPTKDKITIINLIKNITYSGNEDTFNSLNTTFSLLEFKD